MNRLPAPRRPRTWSRAHDAEALQDGGLAGGVCDLTEAFDLSGPTVSHHLKVLRQCGLITGERRGTWVYYRVEPDVLSRLSAVLTPA